MKKIIKMRSAVLLSAGLLFCTSLLAKEDNSEKTKTYTKTYDVSSSDKISIENSFGQTKLVTWASDKVEVDVEIKVNASSDEKAQRLLDAITIEDGKSGSRVFFKTNINSNNKGGKGNHTKMEINYIVHLPAGNPLDLKTQFGDTYLPDYTGAANIEVTFGSLIASNLANVQNLSVQFGKADIESIANATIKVGYSAFSIKKISGDIDAEFNFCPGKEIKLDNTVKSLKIANNYSTVKINADKGLSADFDIETHFGEFKNHSDYTIVEEKEKEGEWKSPKFDYHFTGKAGNGDIKVRIKSNFGNTTIQ
jgi:hypothetical protein